MRRLGKRDLGRGWQAWLDEFLEKRRKKRLLAAAAGRLIKPALTAALTQWRKGWQEEQTSMLEEGQAQLRSGQEVCHTGLEPQKSRPQAGRSATHTLEPCLGQVLIKVHEREIGALRASMEAALESKDEEMRSLAERLGGEILTKEQGHQVMLAQQAEEHTLTLTLSC